MIEVEGRSIEAWSVLAAWRDVRLAAGQQLTLMKRRGDGKTNHVFAPTNLVKRR